MAERQIIRHFIYCDVSGINSIYPQMYSNVGEISITGKKTRRITGKAGLEYIMQGFLGINASGEYSRDWTTEQSSKVTISIEDKVRMILQQFEENIKIDNWNDGDAIVAGYATIIDYQFFSQRIRDILSKADSKYPDFEAFLEDTHGSAEFETLWAKFREFANKNGCCNRYGRIERLSSFLRIKEEVIMKSIAVDLKYPVFLHYSVSKLLMSHSLMQQTSLMNRTPKTGILGIMRKADTNIYVIKPLAMWFDLTIEGNEHLLQEARHFIKFKEQNLR